MNLDDYTKEFFEKSLKAEPVLGHAIGRDYFQMLNGDLVFIKTATKIAKEVQRREIKAGIEELEQTMPHTDGMRHYNTVVKRITELEQQLKELEEK